MRCFLFLLAGAFFVGGCDKQTKLNVEKTAEQTQKLMVLQGIQSKQLAVIQSQLTSLAPTLDKVNGSYFEKNHEDAIFFHTNQLYMLLLVDRKIESELHTADTERQADHAQAYAYHTNLTETMYLCAAQIENILAAEEGRMQTNIALSTAQIEDALTEQESRLETNINTETKRLNVALGNELIKQIQVLAPDAAELSRRKQLADGLAQIKVELAQIKAQLATIATAQLPTTNPPALPPRP